MKIRTVLEGNHEFHSRVGGRRGEVGWRGRVWSVGGFVGGEEDLGGGLDARLTSLVGFVS